MAKTTCGNFEGRNKYWLIEDERVCGSKYGGLKYLAKECTRTRNNTMKFKKIVNRSNNKKSFIFFFTVIE